MDSIQLMVEEHTYIVRMLHVLRAASQRILDGEEIIYDDFDEMIDFLKNYADKHHHGKEEKFLFLEMVEHLGKLGHSLINAGMLVEHDWGRLFISELTSALGKVKAGDQAARLDVIANAVGYTNHLQRHIKKEDELVYSFAEKNLAKEILNKVNEQTAVFEIEAEKAGVQKHYLDVLVRLEKIYIK